MENRQSIQFFENSGDFSEEEALQMLTTNVTQEQEIKIQNIVAIGKKGEWQAEFEENSNSDDPIARLIEHFKFLVQYAKEAHQRKLHEDTRDAELITRLIMSEFSCYTKNQPLILAQYKNLSKLIESIVLALPPNIHLILGTFPVLWANGVLHNTGLHIQSPRKIGEKVLIHHFDKHYPFHSDPKYYKETGDPYPVYRLMDSENYYLTQYSPDNILKGTSVCTNDINQYKSAFRVITRDEQCFLVAIDICYDHEMQFALANTIQLQQQLASANMPTPKKASHVIISHSIHSHRDSIISRSIVHADHNAAFQNCTETLISRPIFGKELKLITHPIQLVKDLETDNIYFFKDNLVYFAETKKMELNRGEEITPDLAYRIASSFLSNFSIVNNNDDEKMDLKSMANRL